MYQLTSQTENKRIYRNAQTGTEITTVLKHKDNSGQNWWVFENLLEIPAIRRMASQKISQLYGANVSIEDIKTFIGKLKANLKAQDSGEKYERAYADLINFENLVNQTADPVKQSLALCTVYVLTDDERIDAFSMQQAAEKMKQFDLDTDLQAFFLSWWMDGISPSMKLLGAHSQIVSKAE